MRIAKYKNLSFEYHYECIVESELPELNKKDALELLLKVQKCAKTNGIELYLSFGTLLGSVRDKDFINGDKDIDTYVKDEEAFFKLLHVLKENGVELVRYLKNIEFSFRDKEHTDVFLDVFILRPAHSLWGLYCYELGGFVTPKKYLRNDGDIEFLGHIFMTPKDPTQILKFWYGNTWNTPIRKSVRKYIYEVKSHYYWKIIASKIFHYVFGENIHIRPHE